jgi:hypothetical protein
VSLFILGAIVMAAATAGVFFFRFWRETGDRLFLMFAVALWLEALHRAVLALSARPSEGDPLIYLVRFIAYALIVVAIIDKNVPRIGRK